MNPIRIIGMAIFILAIMLNPATISYIYTYDHEIDSDATIIAILLVEVLILLLGAVTIETADKLKKEWILFYSILLAIYLGMVMIDFTETDNLIYEKNMTQVHSTNEFIYMINTNSLGIRGEEVQEDKDYGLVIGDSQTFGISVDNEQTIPYLLGDDYLNLGKTGGMPLDYVIIYNNIVKEIKPKDVIVIFYLGNDLDVELNLKENLETYGTSKFYEHLFLKSAVNKLKKLKFTTKKCEASLPEDPKELNQVMYQNYFKINKTLYGWASANKSCINMPINPYYVRNALENPNYFQTYFNDKDKLNKFEIFLRLFNDRIEKDGIEPLFVFIPASIQVSEDYHYMYHQLNMDVTNLTNTETNRKIMNFCKNNNIKCLDMLPAFKNSEEELYWTYDVHLNAKGYELVADAIKNAKKN